MKKIGSYANGNYTVHMFDDGTKIRYNKEDHFDAAFPESCDIKICNRCEKQCPQCHEQSTPDGALANLKHPLLDSFKPYTELAIGGGNPLSHPDLISFLQRMKEQKVICNMTVNIAHFISNYDKLLKMSKDGLIHGLGVSVGNSLEEKYVDMIANFPNSVIHVIAGIVSYDNLKCFFNKNIKLLILGYKQFGRGKDYYKSYSKIIDKNIEELENIMPKMIDKFAVISFDNLAISQLHVKDHLDDEKWNTCYMGDDGEFTMYVDLVKEEYAVSSVSPRKKLFSNNIEAIFKDVKLQRKNKKQ